VDVLPGFSLFAVHRVLYVTKGGRSPTEVTSSTRWRKIHADTPPGTRLK